MSSNTEEARKLLKGHFKLFTAHFKINMEGRSLGFLYLFKFMSIC